MTYASDPIPQITRDDEAAGSGDLVAGNVARLKELFPEIMIDGTIDFEILREILGDSVEGGEERYGLNWKGKRKARAFALTPSLGTLLPAPEDSVDWNTTQNLMIEGDNLETLKLLRRSYAGQVKLIYIDPPYNTGKDFVYPDNYTESISTYLALTGQSGSVGELLTTDREAAGRLHAEWLSMMYPRLILAKEMLADKGVIAISIEEREYSNLWAICCDIFGQENIVGTIVWKNATDNNPTNVAVEHEYIIVVARSKAAIDGVWRSRASAVKDILIEKGFELSAIYHGDRLSEEYDKWYRAHRAELWPLDRYKYIDEGGIYTGSQSVHNPGKEGYRYDVLHPVTGKPTKQPLLGYRFPKETMDKLLNDDRILFGEDENKIVELKVYAKDYSAKLPSWVDIDGRLGAYDLRDDFPESVRVFSNPKPVSLISLLISYTAVDDGDCIMDFFAGSGTTGRGVWQATLEDGVARRCILVQLPELLEAGQASQNAAVKFLGSIGKPANIAELTKERLRRAGAKIRKEHPGAKIDTGFRVYKLATSNLKPWQPDVENLEASILDAVDNVLPGRTENDLLVELLLKTGIDLTLPEEKRSVSGQIVHAMGGGTLMVSLGNVDADDAEALSQGIADWVEELDPVQTTVYFKDTGLGADGNRAATKANLAAILRQRLGDRIAKIASI
ncbi:site-specific DNA-methyltransferase [Sphingobium sp. JS3065]|uniref:site-specific DNA-methyltransferase n=1 Tax=Sphingobium sp. JS3065 TaxID=2970925 RepID=UPI0022647511|nr:site-specific DNA-methyltransferase [Sphingobium sp. JS3065]UZW54827.1 site-specific DNA-methyltransferase [Sphingobium sp. JS3065]